MSRPKADVVGIVVIGAQGFAIKTIKKSKVSRIESLRREIEILRCVDHPCIIKLYDVYEDDRFIHLVTELCTGGELFDRIIQKTESEEGHYSEKDAKVFSRTAATSVTLVAMTQCV